MNPSSHSKGRLLLLPALLDLEGLGHMPVSLEHALSDIQILVSERPKTTRSQLKVLFPTFSLQRLTYLQLSNKSTEEDWNHIFDLLDGGHTIGYMSEAGLPCIADPGTDLVSYCHQRGHLVVPLSGPSSIFLALMGSGMSGQHFRFVGYVPIKTPELREELKSLEKKAVNGETQIFIETPYRNIQLLESIIKYVNPRLRLCVACALTSSKEKIVTKTIADWATSSTHLDLDKKPSVFLLGL